MFPKRKDTKNISIYQVFMKKNAKYTEITLQMFMLITAELQIRADGFFELYAQCDMPCIHPV